MKRLAAMLMLALLCLPSCGRSRRATDSVAGDKEVENRILWALKDDRRFEEVWVDCTSGAITIRGRVSSHRASEDAEKTALSHAYGRPVTNQILVKEK